MHDDPGAPVLWAATDGVALITLNRPERQNAWTPEMSALYPVLLERAAEDPMVRVVVVTGAGGHFCPGGDAEKLTDLAGKGEIAAAADRRPPWTALTIGKPVIAAIPGVCFGFGMYQALCCDIRFCAEDAKFSTAYARRGLVAEMGMSWLLPRLVGTGRAADLLFSARVVRAEEAERIGLVSRIAPAAALLEQTMAYARAMAAQASPRSLRMMKQQLCLDLTCGFVESFDRAEAMLAEAIASADFAEGIRSWQEQRAPAFPPLASDHSRIDVR